MAMAGCGSYSKIEGFAFLPVTCFTMALTTFVSQNLGAKQYDRAKKGEMCIRDRDKTSLQRKRVRKEGPHHACEQAQAPGVHDQ